MEDLKFAGYWRCKEDGLLYFFLKDEADYYLIRNLGIAKTQYSGIIMPTLEKGILRLEWFGYKETAEKRSPESEERSGVTLISIENDNTIRRRKTIYGFEGGNFTFYKKHRIEKLHTVCLNKRKVKAKPKLTQKAILQFFCE